MNVLKASFWTLVLGINVCTLTYRSTAQSTPEVPFDIDFAGVTVHLNEQGRAKLRNEVGQLYTDRTRLHRDIELLRQLTPLLEPILKANQFPVDYRYAVLPFDGDEPTGYWGLTPNRAQALNMVMSNAVDERYHPVVATETVTGHLSRLHTTSNNYVLTLLRYLQPDTSIDRSADKVNSTYLLLDAQSPSLIWKIIARKLVFEREEPILRSAQTYLLYEQRKSGGYSLQAISQHLQLDEERLRPFNDWLKAGTIPSEKDYSVLVRVTADEFPTIKNRGEIRWKPTVVRQTDVGFPVLTKLSKSTVITYESAVFYTINDRLGVQAQPCDNVITLAHYGKITIKTLLSYNDLSERDVVQPGHIYYLERKARRAKVPFHVVEKNQTLREISDVYGVQLKSLLRFNRSQPTQRIQTGRIVWLQEKRPRRQPVEYRQQPVDELKPVIDEAPAPAPSVPATPIPVVPTPVAPVDSLLLQITTLPAHAGTDKTEPTEVPSSSVVPEEVTEEEVPSVDPSDDLKEVLKQHVVRPGQTYYSISQLYGVPLKQLYAWNNLSERVPLRVGQELIVDLTQKRRPVRTKPKVTVIPKAQAKPAVPVATPLNKPAERVSYHVVQPGQTVYRVALINKVSVADLMRWNNLTNYVIEVGQKLLIRKGK